MKMDTQIYYVNEQLADGEWYNIYRESYEKCVAFMDRYKKEHPTAEIELGSDVPQGAHI